VVTLGVDLASAAKRTAVCWIRWEQGRAEVVRLDIGADDEALIQAIAQVDKAGIDVSFGWPQDFVHAVAAYTDTGLWPDTLPQPSAAPKQLQFRETDRFVHRHTGRWPLSVSSDRIAIPAMRAAALFSRLVKAGEPVARDGSGKLVEVYPAAALRRWGLKAQGYKGKKNREARCRLLEGVIDRTAGCFTVPSEMITSCETSDDALDSLLASLVARAATRQLCDPIPADAAERAQREGWIALPVASSLADLAI
jgi:hypothetical protein